MKLYKCHAMITNKDRSISISIIVTEVLREISTSLYRATNLM